MYEIIKFKKIKWKSIFGIFLFLFIGLLTSLPTYATHMIGGEVSYSCLGGNMFRVNITLFQNCFSEQAVQADYPFQFAIYENSPTKPLIVADSVPDERINIEFIPHGFSNECVSDIPSVCFRKSSGFRDVFLPPSPYGYTIVYQRCCRNEGIQNIMFSGNFGVTYKAEIPPFASGACPNNSAQFVNMPPQIICSNYPFMYSYAATDVDGDSLVYRLCESYIGADTFNPIPQGAGITPPPFTPVTYAPGMSYNNPIIAFPPATIDPNTGLLTVTPSSSGRFQVTVCVDEYRDGVLVNTHSRDLQYLITNCSKLVTADIPLRSDEPNTYKVVCDNYAVFFENTSSGAMTYAWDFGDGSAESNEVTPTHTYADTGTYEVKLTINRGTTCPDSIVRLVKVYPYFSGDFQTSGMSCPNYPVDFMDSISSTYNNPYIVSWDFGDGNSATGSNPTHTYTKGGDYIVTMSAKSELGCEVVVSKTVRIRDFVPFAGNDTIIVLGYEFNLNASGGDIYHWTPADYLSDPNIPNPSVHFVDTGYYTYVVGIGADEGCEGSDTINILVVKEPSILMPNAFSPNGDGVNDVFKPKIVGYPYVEYFAVFNRWGERVFIGYKNDSGWDGTYSKGGKKGDVGVYFWELSVKNLKGESVYLKGDVSLIR